MLPASTKTMSLQMPSRDPRLESEIRRRFFAEAWPVERIKRHYQISEHGLRRLCGPIGRKRKTKIA